MQTNNLRLLSLTFMVALSVGIGTLACTDDGGDENATESETGDGDGDPAGDGDGDTAGDGDGDTAGDGDGDTPGDGDGDTPGDGDGDTPGDGDGDTPGDGDGDTPGDGDGDTPGDGDGDPPGDLSFAGDIYPVIANSCSCHVAGAPNGLAMPDADTAFGNLVGVGATGDGNLDRVSAGDPENSYFIQKVRGTQGFGSQMPLNGGPLPDMVQMMFADWVAQGANP